MPGVGRERLLFTPNFAPRAEYAWALERGLRVTVDNLSILRDWPALFDGREIFLRLDASSGHGHHEKVRTGGLHSKFGVPPEEFAELPGAVAAAGARVIGLHAHGGSGNFDLDGWLGPARSPRGGSGAPSRACGSSTSAAASAFPSGAGQAPVDLRALEPALAASGRRIRGSICGWNPVVSSWRQPAYCSRA